MTSRIDRPGAAGAPPRAVESRPDPDVRIGPLAVVPALLQEAGCDPAPLFAKAGLDLALFASPDPRIPFAAAGALLAACAAATRKPHFGVLAGSRFDFATMGVLTHLMLDSPDVRTALVNLVRHLHLNDRGAVPFLLDLGQNQVALGYAVYRHDTPGIPQVYDVALAIGCVMLRSLCGPGWKPLLVTLSHSAPRDTSEYRRHFAAPVRFDAPHSEIVFASHWLERPLADADTSRHIEAQRIALARERGDGHVGERVQRVVQGLVMMGDATTPRIAGLLGLHERALRRRLEAEGTSVHAIVNAARFEVARQLLRETRLPLSEIAAALHYSDATAFSRAFRGWAGTSPRTWRMKAAAATASPQAPG
jgi:AraC-like DNA-binding protein